MPPEKEKQSPTCTNPICQWPPTPLLKSKKLSSPGVWFCLSCAAYYDEVRVPKPTE